MPARRSKIYLSGIFVSALGSMTYAATLPAVLFTLGVSASFIGLLIGSMRINSFLVNSFLGDIGDRVNPRTVLIFCEIGAALSSFLILASWALWSEKWLVPFFIANNVRVFFTALQSGSVQKLGKNYDGLLGLKGRFAVRMSGANNGALLVGGLMAMIFFPYISVYGLVLFDAVTFLINGAIIFLGLDARDHIQNQKAERKPYLKPNFTAYYKALPLLALMDILLSLALCGSNTLNVRLLSLSPELVPLMPTLFGAAAFICSTLSLDRKFKPTSNVLWFVLGTSLLLQGLLIQIPVAVLVVSFVRNLSYWIIYNCIGRELMANAPSAHFSSIASGRNALSVCVLALGEFWVGFTKNIPMIFEMLWRSLVSFAAIFIKKEKLQA